MKPGQRDVYYLAAPSRQLAESSPYFEALKNKDVEILFCYESYDELVLMQLQQFDKKKLTSVEKEMRQTSGEGGEEEVGSFGDRTAHPWGQFYKLIYALRPTFENFFKA